MTMQSKLGKTDGGLTMNREEILEKSRKENDGIDFVALKASDEGSIKAWLVALVAYAIMLVIDLILRFFGIKGVLHLNEAGIVLLLPMAVKYSIEYKRVHIRKHLNICIVASVCCFIELALLILSIFHVVE